MSGVAAAILLAIGIATTQVGCVPALVPTAGTLTACEASIWAETPRPTLLEFLSQSVFRCGADWVALLGEIALGKHPELASLQADAQAAQADPVKMEAMRAAVFERVGLLRAGLH